MRQLEIHQFACLKDNYGVLIHDREAGVTGSIDAPDAEAVRREVARTGSNLTHIFSTHHHTDHTAGNTELKAQTSCTIVGPRAEAARIPGITVEVGDGEALAFGGFEIRVLDTPGHTMGHVSYYVPQAKVAFTGDTLFAMGCGRVFEGSYEMMWQSLCKIAALPKETQIYCGHEYTLANARFALTIEPENRDLQLRAQQVEQMRAEGQPTLPTTIEIELATNPFLRAGSLNIRRRLGMMFAPDWKVFAEIRERKNRS